MRRIGPAAAISAIEPATEVIRLIMKSRDLSLAELTASPVSAKRLKAGTATVPTADARSSNGERHWIPVLAIATPSHPPGWFDKIYDPSTVRYPLDRLMIIDGNAKSLTRARNDTPPPTAGIPAAFRLRLMAHSRINHLTTRPAMT